MSIGHSVSGPVWPPEGRKSQKMYPCRASGGREVNYDNCVAICATSQRNRVCGGCSCRWRVCTVCVLQRSPAPDIWVKDPERGLCEFHINNGVEAVWRAPDSPAAVAKTPAPQPKLPSLPPVAKPAPKPIPPLSDVDRGRHLDRVVSRLEVLIGDKQLSKMQQELLGCLAKELLEDAEIARETCGLLNSVPNRVRTLLEQIDGLGPLPEMHRRRIAGEAWAKLQAKKKEAAQKPKRAPGSETAAAFKRPEPETPERIAAPAAEVTQASTVSTPEPERVEALAQPEAEKNADSETSQLSIDDQINAVLEEARLKILKILGK